MKQKVNTYALYYSITAFANGETLSTLHLFQEKNDKRAKTYTDKFIHDIVTRNEAELSQVYVLKLVEIKLSHIPSLQKNHAKSARRAL